LIRQLILIAGQVFDKIFLFTFLQASGHSICLRLMGDLLIALGAYLFGFCALGTGY
jgi:hypothetical protein